ncbi:MAG: hypothetical protein IJU70_12175 [Lentisphaeria bacterium]|nr:hypothetical protein [Lentisphaeria bacterium]
MTRDRTAFIAGLRRLRRRRFLHLLPRAAADSLTWAMGAGGAAALLRLFRGSMPELPVVCGTVFIAAWACLAWKRFPGLRETARAADGDGKTQVLNAWELIGHAVPDSDFSEHAVRQGIAALDRSDCAVVRPQILWKRLGLAALFMAASVSLPSPRRSVSGAPLPPLHPRTEKTAGDRRGATSAASLRHVAARRGEGGADGNNAADGRSGSGRGNRGEGGGHGHAAARAAASGSEGSGESAGGGMTKRHEEESPADPPDAFPRKTGGKSPGGGATGTGGGGGEDENREFFRMTAGASGSGGKRSGGERRRKNVSRRREPARGGFQILLPDTAPQAGRKPADREEKGDQPGTGRGGESGVKKSRGAAAALPVIPQPDSVAGRLGAGEDVTSVEHASRGGTSPAHARGPAPGAEELPGNGQTAPAPLRRRVRNILISPEQENRK